MKTLMVGGPKHGELMIVKDPLDVIAVARYDRPLSVAAIEGASAEVEIRTLIYEAVKLKVFGAYGVIHTPVGMDEGERNQLAGDLMLSDLAKQVLRSFDAE